MGMFPGLPGVPGIGIGGGSLSGVIGANNTYQANLAQLPQYDYMGQANNALGNEQTAFKQGQDLQHSQMNFEDVLRQQALGQAGPSVAQLQMQQGLGQTNQALAAALASGKGINPALAARMATQQQGINSQNVLGQTAQLRAQEQLANQSNYANYLSGLRGQNLAAAQQQAQLATGLGGLSNQQNQLNLSNVQGVNQLNAGVAGQNAQMNAGLLGGLVGAAGSIGSMAALGGGSGASGVAAAAPLAAAAAYDGGKISDPKQDFLEAIKKMTKGGAIGGKAKVEGDSPENDTVPAKLSPGEIVIPRSISHSGDKAKAFVDAINKRKSPKEAKKVAMAYGGEC